jgi:membrane-bound lytic murein transglycosylase A
MKKLILFGSLFLLWSCGDLSPSGDKSGGAYISGANHVIPRHFERVSYSQLPGWREDDHRYALKAFKGTCAARPQTDGQVIMDRALLEEKCRMLPPESASAPVVRAWFESHFQPYKAKDPSGKTTGTFTGYYSPVVKACRKQTDWCSVPIMDIPNDGRNYKGVDSKKIVRERIGQVIYWIHPIDLQDMGSATLILEDGAKVKVNVASTNDLPFNGIGGQLQKKGIRPPNGSGMKNVREYLKQNPKLAQELVDNNPRYVFYREASTFEVIGKMGVPLTQLRSIAMDDSIYALGMPVYVNTNLSDGRKYQRLMIAQDTGGAIKGWVRADLYFGVGDEAFTYAQGQHAQGEKYILMPKPYQYVRP